MQTATNIKKRCRACQGTGKDAKTKGKQACVHCEGTGKAGLLTKG